MTQTTEKESLAAALPNLSLADDDRRVVAFYEGLPPFRGSAALHLGFRDGTTGSHREAVANMNRELAERVALQAGDRVLDAGCGYGASAVWLAREVGAEVVGVNIVPGQLHHARRAACLLGLSGLLTFEREDFTRTSFPDASFDVVWAVESVCHTADKEGFMAEARRLLAPGGRLVVADFFRSARPFAAGEESLLQSWLSGWAVPDLMTAGEFEEYARQAGFDRVGMEDITANILPSARRLYQRALLGYPATALLRALRYPAGLWLSTARSGLTQYRALRRDLWFYGIFTAR